MNAETALAELITSTGPIGSLIVALAIYARGELRRQFADVATKLDRLQTRDDEHDRRITELERDRRQPTIPPAHLHPPGEPA